MLKLSGLIPGNLKLDELNFDNFSQSKYWVGYFERKGSFDSECMGSSVKHVMSYFQPHFNDYITLSALSYDDAREHDKEINSKYGSIFITAKDRGFLRSLSEDYESFLYGEAKLQVTDITLSINDEFTWDLCRLLMMHGGVLGEVLFIAFIKQGVIVYPHKDTGFGVISMDPTLKMAKDFLTAVAQDERFDVYWA